jgi:3-methyladenine DNA glycosylase/8-oxoguanine DNA glycosylase
MSDVTRRLGVPDRYEFAATIRGLALIQGDPTLRFEAGSAWFGTRTPDGPGTLSLRKAGGELVATAYGPGAQWLTERADAIAGLRDDISGFAEVAERHPLVRRLAREHAGLRMAATGRVFHHLVPAVLGQKVTGKEAHASYVRLLQLLSEPAPGPNLKVRLPPEPDAVAGTPYWAMHPLGIEQKRADTLRRAAVRAAALERCADAAEATTRLKALPGIGVWTAAEVTRVVYGDADVVSVGDYHIKNTVSWALAGEPRGTDERMLELLEPFAGHRGRVCALLAVAGIGAPRYGPRMPLRSFARF